MATAGGSFFVMDECCGCFCCLWMLLVIIWWGGKKVFCCDNKEMLSGNEEAYRLRFTPSTCVIMHVDGQVWMQHCMHVCQL